MEKLIIDVRTREEFVKEHIVGAICIPHYDLEHYLGFLQEKEILLYCNTERRSKLGQAKLAGLGVDSRIMPLDEQDSYEWVAGTIVCALNHVRIKPGHEKQFMEKAMQLCQMTEHMDGFLGSKTLRISGMSGIGSFIDSDLSGLEFKPTRMILMTYWKSKDAHEVSHRDPAFKAIFNSLAEHLTEMPVEEFYEVLK